MNAKKLYLFILVFSFAGFIWLFINIFIHTDITVCIFRGVTGIPCPSCGITGTLRSVFYGNLSETKEINFLSFLILPMIFVIPFWIISDLLFRKQTFYRFYLKTENILKRRKVAVPLLIVLLLNWIWILFKHFYS